ncbi:biotin transporter BioY [Cupriavidus taiwanensis]|uniref:molybdopterin-dependent oxidoreductase n=1 Tax=Cupriavidus taiwanensis TaxID=164546 RepID=UPI001F00BA6C|nr:molybdopterin-dependent oxidoreductase [Cupriavidus taiwanensis]ULX50693.1 biotin transporter BioY [Cupriavidus taiwanensis]
MAVQKFSHCSHWGAYTLLVENNRIVGVEPFAGDPSPSPVIHSVKYWAESANRIAQPMVRKSWLAKRGPGERKANEAFVPVSWEQANQIVASEIDRVRHEYGNASIFAGSYGWTSCGRFHHAPSQIKRMLNLVGGYTGHVDTYSIAAGPVILRHVLGDSEACNGGATTLDAVARHAQTVVVFGGLSPRTAQSEAGGVARHQLESHLRAMVDNGVRFFLVSPMRDDLPEWVPAEWLPVRPNTDAAVMLGLAGEIVSANRHDQAFLNRYCSGSDRFLAYLAGQHDGVRKDAEWAARISSLDADCLKALARRLVDTRSMVTVSWSLQRADHGEQPYWAALALASVIGQIGLPGTGVGFGYGSLGGVGSPLSQAQSPAFPQGAKPNADFIPCARIADLLLEPGSEFTYEGMSHTYPDIRLVYWAGGNPFHHHQDLNRLRKAWSRPETIIVQEPMWTATARRADIVLPATTSIERNDIAGNRRSDHLIAMHQAIRPLGMARNDYDIVRGIAACLGVESAFSEGRDEMQWIRMMYERSARHSRERLGVELPEFETFWERGSTPVPTRPMFTYLEAFRRDPDGHRLNTESGRIVLGSDKLATLCLDDCPPCPSWIPPAEWLGCAGPEEFHLVSRQPAGKLHSQLDEAPVSMATKHNGRERVWIHPGDAARLSISDGDAVRLWNDRGQCLASASVTDAVRPGVLMLPTGAWYAPEDEGPNALDVAGNPNVLTLDKGSSGFSQGCAAHTCLVRMEKHQPGRPGSDLGRATT